MIYIDTGSTDAAYNFAVEEHIAGKLHNDGQVWMIWRAEKCVMLGRNQVAEAEVDLHAADENQIGVVRRSSGGGAIYTDSKTVQYSMITKYSKFEGVRDIFRNNLGERIVLALRHMGVPAEWTSRNDIYAEGSKISGAAMYILRDRVCCHGSLLYDTDLSVMDKVLRSDGEKIRTKALRSIGASVTTVKKYCDAELTICDFIIMLKNELMPDKRCVHEYSLTDADKADIDNIRIAKYADPEWTYGRAPRFTFHNRIRFPGGKLEVFLDIDKGVIKNCAFTGDFLSVRPAADFAALLDGVPYQYEKITQKLRHIDIAPYLGGITKEQLLSCLFNAKQ